MNMNEYQEKAMSFRLKSSNELYAILGLVGEVGELASHLAKSIRDGGDVDVKCRKELGDILWMVAAVASDMNVTLEELANENINKLEDRKGRNMIQGSGDER